MFVHDIVLHVKFELVIVEALQLSLQVADVGLQHGLHVGGGGGLSLQQVPLGFQHFVLLFQVSYLWHQKEVPKRIKQVLTSFTEVV